MDVPVSAPAGSCEWRGLGKELKKKGFRPVELIDGVVVSTSKCPQ